MLGHIARFEFRYHLLSPAFIAITLIIGLFAFGIAATPQISVTLSDAVNTNSPQEIMIVTSVFGLFGMVIPAVFLASGILRDRNFNTHEIFFSSPVRERDYLIGRFIGGFAITALAFLVVPFGHFLGAVMPWVDPESIGPFNAWFYLYPLLTIGLANMLILGLILFTVANLTRSLLFTWIALLALIVSNAISGFLLENPDMRTLAALVDPFGGNAVFVATQYWTASEQNTQIVPLEGLFLQNRLIWLGVAAALFVFNVLIFSYRRGNILAFLQTRTRRAEAPFVPRTIELPRATPTLDRAAFQQFWTRVAFEVKGVVFNIAFWILLGIGILLVIINLSQSGQIYGTPSYPVTRLMMNAMISGFILVPVIVVIFYASELMWRERNVRFSDIVDVTPAPNWVFLLAKLIAMIVVIVSLIAVAYLITIAAQLLGGYTNLELGQYALRGLVDLVIPLTLLAMLAIFFQVIANNKWIGIIAIGALFIITSFVLGPMGLDHTLYRFPFVNIVPYSDLNGFGHFLGIELWRYLYWGSVTGFLFILAFVMWNRGVLLPITRRIFALPRSFGPATGPLAALLLLVAAGSGGWIYYNTVVINDYIPGPVAERRAADFEREWRGQLEGLAQPTITDVDYTIDIFPHERRLDISGTNVLVNDTDTPIPVVWVSYGAADLLSSELGGAGGEERSEYANLHAYELDPPLQPGERRTLSFTAEITNPGFANSGNNSSVRDNGTFFNNGEFAPVIGFSRTMLIQDPSVRRRQDLPELERAFSLEDESRWDENYIRQDSDYVTFRTLVSTSEGQTVVAPGYLQRDWVENGRRYFEYVMEDRSLNFFNWMSGEYALAEEVREGITYQIFHHPDHDWNIARMMEAAQDTLAYMSEQISPYQYRQYRTLEFPYGGFAQSFPNTIAYSENVGFIADLTDPDDIDYVYYITAHEAAHQWWAHQIMGPNVQGGAVLVETFAQYSALMVMQQEYGADHMRRFLKYELDSYLQGRRNESREEVPLYRVENQGYIHYRKGAVVMYALQDYVGEDVVNRALARLVAEFQYQSDPYPTTLDFLRILRAEAGPEHERMIHDFFERIVLFDLSVSEAEVREREDGRFETTMTVEARLFEADGAGNETEEPIDYVIDIAAFTRGLDGAIEGTDHILHFERQRITEAEQTFSFVTDIRPAMVGIDPYNKLIDRNSDDNLLRPDFVSGDGPEAGGGTAEPGESSALAQP